MVFSLPPAKLSAPRCPVVEPLAHRPSPAEYWRPIQYAPAWLPPPPAIRSQDRCLALKRPCGRLKTIRHTADRATHRRAGAVKCRVPLAFFQLGLFGGLHVDVVIEEP